MTATQVKTAEMRLEYLQKCSAVQLEEEIQLAEQIILDRMTKIQKGHLSERKINKYKADVRYAEEMLNAIKEELQRRDIP